MLLVAALRATAVRQRQAIVLHYLVGLAIEEVANEMGVSTGTVSSWLARGRAALHTRLAEPTRSGNEERPR